MSSSKAQQLREEGEKNGLTLMDRIVNDVVQPAVLPLVERGMLPDGLLRFGMRKLLQSTLNMLEFGGSIEKQSEYFNEFVDDIKIRNIAEQTKAANDQHYEVPAEFYKIMLGENLKYSSCLWKPGTKSLKQAEEDMLQLFCERAELHKLKPGSHVLDLGCGWGSCVLYAAKHFPQLKFSCVSNSESQRHFIEEKCAERGLTNVTPKTSDINVLDFPKESFDRIMSTEMFEHMKNYEKLFAKVASWLKQDGKLMVHIFCHKMYPYHFQDGWMSDNFFTGGTMPSKDLFLYFNNDLLVERQWSVNGVHYAKTLDAWLEKLDQNKQLILKMFKQVYGSQELKRFNDWRLFCMACSELFGFNGGNEWFVSHYRFVKK